MNFNFTSNIFCKGCIILVVLLRASNDVLALLPKPCHRPNPFDQGSRLANVAQIFGSPGAPSKVQAKTTNPHNQQAGS